MTDLESKRQAVINASREHMQYSYGTREYTETLSNLKSVVKELYALQSPDPWELLREYVSGAMDEDGKTWEEFCQHWEPRVREAIAWHDKQEQA